MSIQMYLSWRSSHKTVGGLCDGPEGLDRASLKSHVEKLESPIYI